MAKRERCERRCTVERKACFRLEAQLGGGQGAASVGERDKPGRRRAFAPSRRPGWLLSARLKPDELGVALDSELSLLLVGLTGCLIRPLQQFVGVSGLPPRRVQPGAERP